MKSFILAVQRPILGLLVFGVSFVSSPVYAEACTPIVSVPTTITVPGVYCLAGDLVFSSFGVAIDVQADDVTVDFKGHEIKGSFTQNMIGVAAGSSSFAHAVIRNGSISNASVGIIIGRNGLVENMRIKDVRIGVQAGGEYSIIKNNVITDVVPKFEASSAGIILLAGCGHLVENNSVRNFRAFQGARSGSIYGNGIRVTGGCDSIIRNNFVHGKSVSGAGEAVGIYDYTGSANLIIANSFSGTVNKNIKCGSTTKYKDNISANYNGGTYDCPLNGDLGGNL